MTLEIISQKPLSMIEVKEEIEKIKKRDSELAFRTARTEEYLNHYAKKESLKLIDTLRKLDMSRLKEEHIVKIADLMPLTVEDLKFVLSGYTITLTKDNLQKIVDEVKKVA